MGTNETIKHSKSEKSSSIMQEQPSVYPCPDWASKKAYYGPGVPIPAPYFGAPVASGQTHPYMWSTQPMLTPFGSLYTAVYPHGGIYSHPSATHIASPINLEVPIMPSTNNERGLEKKIKVLDNLPASIGSNTKSAGSYGNKSSESGDNGAEDSSNGSDVNNESGGSDNRSGCPEVPPSSASDALPTISLGMSSDPAIITGKPCTVFRANLTPEVDPRPSCASKLKSEEEHILPSRDPVEEKEMKREKRKQSNRESARRSRLRKQAETEELAIKFGTLTAENTALRSEITRLTERSDKLRSVKSALKEKLRMAKSGQRDVMASVRINYDHAPSVAIENLLSRIDNCGPICESHQMEEEPPDGNSSAKLHQLLDSSPRTDSIAAS